MISFPRPIRPIVILIIILVVSLTLFSRASHSSSEGGQQQWISPSSIEGTDDLGPAHVRIQDVLNQIMESIASSVDSYDPREDEERLGLKLGNLSMEGYKDDLQSTFNTFFSSSSSLTNPPSPDNSPIDPILIATLSHLSPIPYQRNPVPKNVFITDLLPPTSLPEQFKSWTELNPDWTSLYVGDEGIGDWLQGSFKDGEGILEIFKWLERDGRFGVVKADLFRYLVLYLNGGIYTDTDTACVRPINDWARNPDRHITNPLIPALPALFSLLPLKCESESTTTSSCSADTSTETDEPNMIISLEVAAPEEGSRWREDTFVRGIQITQWTLMSGPHHPILLDVLGRALGTAKEIMKREEEGAIPDILEWSGPGAFSDAVLRYLLVRHGVHPRKLAGLAKPLRIGDVVIMPVNSFRADASEGFQGEDKLVWHGFFGRWKEK